MNKALVIGINAYPHCPLAGCISDAEAVACVLERNSDSSVNFCVNKALDVTQKGQLKGLIKNCFTGDSEIALFYFSGHGFIDSIGGYIVTPDYSDNDMGVSMQEIMTIVNASECKNKVVILDCCHSGFLGSISSSGQSASIIGKGVTLLTASKSDESAMEIAGHGVFTSFFLDALYGGAADVSGNVTAGAIYAYIDKALGPWGQRPVFKTNVMEFSSLRKVVPRVSSDILRKINLYFDRPEMELRLDPSFEPTNSPITEHKVIEPYADEDHVKIFTDLQILESVGLVVPCDEEHMYFAAIKSKSCKLTAVGQHYWRLAHNSFI